MNFEAGFWGGLALKDLKISEWKAVYEDLSSEDFLEISRYEKKKGVLELRKKALARLEKNAQLLDDWHRRNQPKLKLLKSGASLVGGMDEVGRGPLAGPVVASVVVLGEPILGLRDSKKLSEKAREKLFYEIKEHSLAYGIGWASEDEIDKSDILSATKLAMRRALAKLGFELDGLLLDGPPLRIHPRELAIVGGDDLSNEIAAASILAKVTRDRWMVEMDEHFPGYGFARHKGYGTEEHRNALIEWGPCPLHRKSFLSFLNEID